MKRILTVFHYMLLRNLRDRGTLVEMLILPIVLILILGNALAPVFQVDNISTITVGYLNQDEGPLGHHLDQYLASPQLQGIIKLQLVSNQEEGLELLRSGQVSALVHLERDFSQQAMAGETHIFLTGRPGYTMHTSAVANILEGFIHGANTVEALQKMGAPDATFVFTPGTIQDLPISASGLLPRAMDYYAVTMLVMFIMWGGLYAANGLGSLMLAVGDRIKSTPVKDSELFLGIILSNFVTVIGQAAVIIGFTHLVYGANWGDNLPALAGIVSLTAILSIAIGVMVTMLARSEAIATRVINVLVFTSTLVAGGYVKISFSGDVLPLLQHLSPNYLSQTAIFNLIYGGSAAQTYTMVGVICLAISACFVIASLAGRRLAR